MIEQDTIKLLRECDAGVKMGIKSISEVIDRVESSDFRKILTDNKLEHEKLEAEIQKELIRFEDAGKDPNFMAKSMSWMKTNVMLGLNDSDKTIADLITDGCNMGVKSLNEYLNDYKAAEEFAKDITKRLINLEERLTVDIRDYL
ncbi:MAG: hypothetical protein IKL10_06630 [Clostridia bacterium]|nr:hypothetical protein [Clostridia bacterium]